MSGSSMQVKPFEEVINASLRQTGESDFKSGSYRMLLCNPLASLVSSLDDNPASANVAILGYN
ncbi:hypothetical protein LMG27952_05045 [Paraburkholderia hiiakae]|uniref:Uncharacterized protein n=1 Tax=Paraburkholderia hiiakae TaxID=1081782 RepID=A0ABM8NZH5_9BURK|nr:hypothetical protein LMG27952_05045 [Paraburkholderia hiiakae]